MKLARREPDPPAVRDAIRAALRDRLWHRPARIGFRWWLAMFAGYSIVPLVDWVCGRRSPGESLLWAWISHLPEAAFIATLWWCVMRFGLGWLIARSVRHGPRLAPDGGIEIRHQGGRVLKRVERDALAEADLVGSKLRDATLHQADLRGSDLRNADLRGACLVRANLEGADLRGARLTGASLNGAGLRGADLSGANLTAAVLTGADLAEARYDSTTTWPPGFDPLRAARRASRHELAPASAPEGRGSEPGVMQIGE